MSHDIDGADPAEALVGQSCCECITHCRTWEETAGGRLPPSQHAPSCKHYRLERFQRVTLRDEGGLGGFIDTPENVASFLEEADDDGEYRVSDVRMTVDQFEKLEEFCGF